MATEAAWAVYTEVFEADGVTPCGNAWHAQDCRETPLEADAILKLLWNNTGYFGDPYYRVLVEPVEMRVLEYFASKGD